VKAVTERWVEAQEKYPSKPGESVELEVEGKNISCHFMESGPNGWCEESSPQKSHFIEPGSSLLSTFGTIRRA